MKIKNILLAIVSAIVSFPVFAAMENVQFTGSIPATTATALGPYVLRGELNGIQVIGPVGSTATVAITSGGYTIFSKAAITAGTNFFFPRAQIHNTSGTAQTIVDSGSNTNSVFGFIPLWGPVTVTITKTDLATNTWSVQTIYNK